MGNEQSGGGGQQYRADYRAHPAAAARSESEAERAERLQRVQAYDEKMKKFAKRDPELIKQENWQKYNAIGSKPNTAAATASAATAAASSSSAAVPPPPAHWNTTNSARVPPVPVAAGYPGAVSNHSLQPKRAVTGGRGYSGTAAASSAAPSAPPASASSSSSSAASLPFDPNRARAARAAAMTAKTSRIKSYKPPVKADQWETYKQLAAIEKGKTAAVPVGATPAYGPGVYAEEAQDEEEEATEEEKALEAAAAGEDEAAAAAAAAGGDGSEAAFYQQMFHLVSKAQRMPVSSLSLLIKILSNLLRADSTPDGSKFRRLKLDNDKMQREIVKVDGAVEILFAVGFERAVGDAGEDVLVCSGDTDLSVARLALDKLQALAERR